MTWRLHRGFSCVLLFVVLLAAAVSLAAAETELTAKNCLDLFLSNSKQVKVALHAPVFARSAHEQLQGAYDTTLNAGLGLTQDESESSFAASERRLGKLDVGLAKHFVTASSLSLGLSGQRSLDVTNDSPIRFFNPALYYNPSYSSRLVFTLHQPLLRGGWGFPERLRLRALRLGADQSLLALKRQLDMMCGQLSELYWDYYLMRQQVAQAEKSLADASRLVVVNKDKLSYGLVEKKDLLQAEAVDAMRRAELVSARGRADDIVRALAVMLSVPVAKILGWDIPGPGEGGAVVPKTVRRESRADLEAARLKLAEKKKSLRLAALEMLPQLDLTGSISSSSLADTVNGNWQAVSGMDYPTYYLGITLAMPLRNRAARAGRTRAWAEWNMARLELAVLEDDIERQIEEARQRWLRAQENLELMRTAERLNSLRLREEQRDFKSGRTNTYFLLLAQDESRRTTMGRLAAEIELEKVYLKVFVAEGRLLQAYDIELGELFNEE